MWLAVGRTRSLRTCSVEASADGREASSHVLRVAMNDVVGQLQEEMNHLCALMYNYTGSLQRDAPPVSCKKDADRGRPRTQKGS